MQELLNILCCPETHQALRMAEPDLISRLNSQVKSGQLRNRAGKPIAEAIDTGLVREDGKFLYPVRGNIPVMLIDDAIPL